VKEIKNLLNKDISNYIEQEMLSNNFAWYIHPVTKKEENFYFVHNFYDDKINSSHFDSLILPILGKFEFNKILRIKGNLYPKTNKIIEHAFHVDQVEDHKVAIYYVNSNNGKTIFKDNQISSEKNKLVLFDGKKEHKSTTCTDKSFRINININYI